MRGLRAVDYLTPEGRAAFDAAFAAVDWHTLFLPTENEMSEHDVTKSSNADVQALLALINTVARTVLRLSAEIDAIRGELASLPESYVVPGPQGQLPAGTVVQGTGTVKSK